MRILVKFFVEHPLKNTKLKHFHIISPAKLHQLENIFNENLLKLVLIDNANRPESTLAQAILY